MKTLGKWYVIAAVVVFTFCVNLGGRTPAGWCVYAISYAVGAAPQLASVGG